MRGQKQTADILPQRIYEIVWETPYLLCEADHAQAFDSMVNGLKRERGSVTPRSRLSLIYMAGVLMGIRQERRRRHKETASV